VASQFHLLKAYGWKAWPWGPTGESIAWMAGTFCAAGLLSAGIFTLLFRKLRMRMALTALGSAGVAAGALLAFVPWNFVSRAEVMITPPGAGLEDPAARLQYLTDRFTHLKEQVLSTKTLTDIVQSPGLNLYGSGQSHGNPKELEKLVERMRGNV